MSALLIDVGNTRIKWARWDGERLSRSKATAHANWKVKDLRRLFAGGRPERVLVSCVAGAGIAAKLAAAARRVGLEAEFVHVPRRGAGVTVGYLEPWRLGVDRYVGAVGAHHLFPGLPVCVVGVGTAQTLDLIDARGRHQGGAIIPGPDLMVRTLLKETHGIGRRARGGSIGRGGFFARSTRAAITQGARYAAAAAVDRAAQEARAGSRLPLVVLTGGGVPAIRPLVQSRCVTVPDLVLRGLAVLSRQPPARR